MRLKIIRSFTVPFSSMRSVKGFTLMEVLMVVVIISLIAAFAMPSYLEQVARGRRAEAKSFLLDLASRQERYYTQYSSYSPQIAKVPSCSNDTCYLGFETSLSPDGHYTGKVEALPSSCSPTGTLCTGYILVAEAIGSDKKCPVLTLDNAGAKGAKDESDTALSGAALDYCWR
ncbi:type IV pilus assembly protein PilE [Alteromonadaceae bacterium Bs31]|nr:type IV pilus assembly protein PilE [Alteromonadaceae bacterium Bs31]